MSKLLMPKATAVWLVENTTLTFTQIARFCELHELEVKGIADGDVATGVLGLDPMQSGQLTSEEIKRCEADPSASLNIVKRDLPEVQTRANAIAWLIKNYPALSDAAIGRLLATTKDTIKGIRERSHWNIANIKPQNPVLTGLCSQKDLQAEIDRIRPSRLAALGTGQAATDDENADGEAAEAPAEANPFAAALAAYAQAAQKKVHAEPTIESVFGETKKAESE